MRLRADREGAKDAATAESFPCKKNCAQIPARARNIALFYNACTRDISPIILRTDTYSRITGASVRANYHVRIYTYNVVRTHTRAYAAYTTRSREYILAVAGYASPDNITSSHGPSF